MKPLLLVTIFFTYSVFTLSAQEASGYYITKSGDTVTGTIQVPLLPKIKIGGSSQSKFDPLYNMPTGETTEINYSALTFDFRFTEDGKKYKKIDRLKVKGFGFTFQNHAYDYITWDVHANKQIYLMPATADVAPNGVYFILRSLPGAYPIYSLFQEIEMNRRVSPDKKEYDGNAMKRDIIFEHPTRGLLYISNQYPLIMKPAQLYKYLEMDSDFIASINEKITMLELIQRYNQWKATTH